MDIRNTDGFLSTIWPIITGVQRRADWTLTHTRHKDTEQSTIETSITLDGVTLTDHRMNDLQFAGRYQCLSIRYRGRLISPQNEHSIYEIGWIGEEMYSAR
jgi:hypothetical protein